MMPTITAPAMVPTARPRPPATAAVSVMRKKPKPKYGVKEPTLSARTNPAYPAMRPARKKVAAATLVALMPVTRASSRFCEKVRCRVHGRRDDDLLVERIEQEGPQLLG